MPTKPRRRGGTGSSAASLSIDVLEAWFHARGWAPWAFQREVWTAMSAGESGLLHATTGAGKPYAAWLGALLRACAGSQPDAGARVLWLTPMRALAADTSRALSQTARGRL